MQADRVGAHWHVVKHFYSSLRSQNEEIEICSSHMYNHSQSSSMNLMWCAKNIPLSPISTKFGTAISLRPSYVFRTCIGRPGCFPGAWSSWIFSSRQFAPIIVNASVRFIRLLFYIFLGGSSTVVQFTREK